MKEDYFLLANIDFVLNGDVYGRFALETFVEILA